MKYYSWDIKSKDVAVKTMDKSVFVHHGTGIPSQIRDFFDMSSLGKGQRKEIVLIFDGVPFNAHIELSKMRNWKGRPVKEESRLFWRSDFEKIVKKTYPIHFDLFTEGVKLKSKMRPLLKFEKGDVKDRYYVLFVEPEEPFEERKVSWKEAVLGYVKELPEMVFTLPDIYKYEPELKKQFPSNINIQPKIRQQIQFLRDDGYIEFVDNRGTYRKLFENDGELGFIEDIMDQVDHKDYRVEDSWGQVKIRKSQDVFRKYVLRNFEYQCCVCQFNLESLLDAHHIRSWKEDFENRLNPLNGLSLCRIHHGAVDQSILRVKKDHKIIVDQNLLKTHNPSVRDFITRYHNRKIIEPIDGELLL